MAIDDSTPGFVSGTFEELQDFMAMATDIANVGLHPAQVALRDATTVPGWFMRVVQGDLVLFGEVHTVERMVADEVAHHDPDLSDLDEQTRDEIIEERATSIRYIRETMPANRQRGYLFGRVHSGYLPDGELGDTHVSEVWPISREAFEQARTLDWIPPRDIVRNPATRTTPLGRAIYSLAVAIQREGLFA